jgi:hypothetical protein
MKNKILAYSFISGILGLGLIGAPIASAHGFFGGFSNVTPDQIATQQQTMFQNEATMLGISVDEVKTAWAAGKSIQDIIKEKNLNTDQIKQRMQDARLAEIKSQLQTLVLKGVITQAQADSRLKFIQDRSQNMKGMRRMMGFRGFGF